MGMNSLNLRQKHKKLDTEIQQKMGKLFCVVRLKAWVLFLALIQSHFMIFEKSQSSRLSDSLPIWKENGYRNVISKISFLSGKLWFNCLEVPDKNDGG